MLYLWLNFINISFDLQKKFNFENLAHLRPKVIQFSQEFGGGVFVFWNSSQIRNHSKKSIYLLCVQLGNHIEYAFTRPSRSLNSLSDLWKTIAITQSKLSYVLEPIAPITPNNIISKIVTPPIDYNNVLCKNQSAVFYCKANTL